MATQRDNPYSAFNFKVDIGAGTDGVIAGFQEVSGLSFDVTMQEYRNGNEPTNHVRKVPAMFKVGDVTLKRGLIGALNLYEWMTQVRNGDMTAARSVVITQFDEARNGPILTWRLVNARPMKFTGPSLNAKAGSDVAIEELVLSCEDLFVE